MPSPALAAPPAAPPAETLVPGAPVYSDGSKLECWVDYHTTPMKDVIAKGRPERIWSSDDPQWDAIEQRGKYLVVSICVGWARRVGDDFLPGTPKDPNPKTRDHFRVPWAGALEMMRLFERQKRLFETPIADAVAEERLLRERGQKEQAETIVSALRDFARTLNSEKTA